MAKDSACFNIRNITKYVESDTEKTIECGINDYVAKLNNKDSKW
jgi:hypothetical protein